MLYNVFDPEEAFNMSELSKKIILDFETLGIPIVAAINGSALGGGMEIALACHYRVSLNDNNIKFGFPEVTLGLFPGRGGVTRLVRLLGLEKSFKVSLRWRSSKPKSSKRRRSYS